MRIQSRLPQGKAPGGSSAARAPELRSRGPAPALVPMDRQAEPWQERIDRADRFGHNFFRLGSPALETAPGDVVQRQHKKGRRSRRKDFKNSRAKQASQKRGVALESDDPPSWLEEGEELPSSGLPLPPESLPEKPRARWSGPSKKERDEERHQRRASKVTPRDDDKLNFREPKSDSIRVYRAEVESFNPQYSHVNIAKKSKKATVYNPPPASKGTLPLSGEKYETGLGGYTDPEGAYIPSKRTPKKEDDLVRYGRKFLRGRENHPKGTMSWINFGEPERALEFHHQKSTNPMERAKGNVFGIKSFRVPSDIYRAVREDTVHERQKKKFPSKAINVDRAAPNQFGLQQHHLDLLNQTAIEGSGRVEDPEKLARKTGFVPPKPKRAPKKKPPKATVSNRRWFGKAERNKKGADLDDLLAAEEDARRESEADRIDDED